MVEIDQSQANNTTVYANLNQSRLINLDDSHLFTNNGQQY